MSQKNKPIFSVFTPVFNGEKHLDRVFRSLTEQTFQDFEWIVIDDGSTDNSAVLIDQFIAEHPEISTTFIRQENRGKHRSWNTAVEKAQGMLFVPADADDYFLPNALQFLFEKWMSFDAGHRERISGLNVLCYDNDTDEVVGDQFPEDGLVTSNLELTFRYKVLGEKWGCKRTDLLKSRKFPIIKASFYPEGYVWFYFDNNYKVICYNTPLRRYYTNFEGLTASSKLPKRTPQRAKTNLHYTSWVLRNFGFYILYHNPKRFFHMLGLCFYDLFLLARSLFKKKKKKHSGKTWVPGNPAL